MKWQNRQNRQTEHLELETQTLLTICVHILFSFSLARLYGFQFFYSDIFLKFLIIGLHNKD